jgi:hypothetical protein
MPTFSQNLLLERCPHCSLANPNLFRNHALETRDHAGGNQRLWGVYVCGGCGGVVTAWALGQNMPIQEHFPTAKTVEKDIPQRPRAFLQQAVASLHAPAGAVLLSASAVDAMLN